MRDATWFSFLFLEKAKKRRELTYCGEEFTIGELGRSEMFKVHCKPSSRKWIVSLNVRIRFIFFVKNFFLVLVWLTAFPLPLKFPPILQKALSEPLTLAVSLQRLGIGLLFSSFAFLFFYYYWKVYAEGIQNYEKVKFFELTIVIDRPVYFFFKKTKRVRPLN